MTPYDTVAVAYWVDYGFSFVDSSVQWRFPIALQIFFALSTIGLIFGLPETPRWLLSHDHIEEAIEVLNRMNIDGGPDVAEQERIEILAAIAQERKAQEEMGSQR